MTPDIIAALEPFAKLADIILSEAPAFAKDIALYTDCTGKMNKITMDQLRAVSAALSTSAAGQEEEPTWPELATSLLAIMREYTGPCPEDGYEGVDLPEELRTWFEGYRDELIRTGSLAPSVEPAGNGREARVTSQSVGLVEALKDARAGFEAAKVLILGLSGSRRSIMMDTFIERIDAALRSASSERKQ